jgi:Fur family ferric uptake transcriptional regulator
MASGWAEMARGELAKSGHRTGGARDAVVELLADESCCLSASEIADELRERDRRVGLASIYRALERLHGLGLVQRLDAGDGQARYERAMPGGEHHHHAVCEGCGELTPFEDAELERAIERLGSRLELAVSAHDVVLHGLCPECKAR